MHKLTAVLAACALLLGACSKVDQSSSSGGRHPWTHPGRLIIGSAGEEPDNLNELFAHTDAADQLANLIYEPLFRYDPDGNFVPAAATSVPTIENGGISGDGKKIVLHLRKGMKWSDGAPYDGRDLVFTWHAVMSNANNVKQRNGWDDITAIDLAPDNLTATLHLKQVYAGLLGIFAYGGAAYPPLPAHLLERAAGPQPRRVQRQADLVGPVRAHQVEPRLVAGAGGKPELLARQARTRRDHLQDRAERRHALQPAARRTRSTSTSRSPNRRSRSSIPSAATRSTNSWSRTTAGSSSTPPSRSLSDVRVRKSDRDGDRLGPHEPDDLPRLQRARGQRRAAEQLGSAHRDHGLSVRRRGRKAAA